jgi:hypothetical protein
MTGGKGVVNHVGARLLADMADATGLCDRLSDAMAPTKQRDRGHDRGAVLTELAVMIADGGQAISGLAALRDQPKLFGTVASNPTAWRTLEAIDGDTLARIRAARAQARKSVWEAGADPGFYVIDIDATLCDSHSDKQHAEPTYKHGYGFHPLNAYLDRTGEALASLLRPGNAGSGTAADHIAVLDLALEQLPLNPEMVEVIVRTDSAGCSHEFLNACADRHVRFMTGHPLTAQIAKVLVNLGERVWQPAITADGGDERDSGQVTEITGLVDLTGWPTRTRMIARREDPHPGAQLTFTDLDGHRFQLCVTNHADPDIAFLEALYRGRGRAERRICEHKDTGLAHLPSWSFPINQAWVELTLIATDLLAWSRLLVLDGDLARAEPKRLRYCLLHTAGQIITTGRRRLLRVPDTWPWASHLVRAFDRLHQLQFKT